MDTEGDGAPILVESTAELLTHQLSNHDTVKVPLSIITEFGDSADIEKALTISQNGEQVQEWLELANGCICCSIKDTGLASIESLITKRGGFDYILLETSGLADPGNLAPLFWTDDGLGSNIYLDGIVTVVDAKNILTSLSEDPAPSEQHAGEHLTTAHLQISHADVIVVNKADAVTSEQLGSVVQRVKSINGLARIHVTRHSRVPHLEGFLLDLHAYDGVKALEEVERGHSHIDPVCSHPFLYPFKQREKGVRVANPATEHLNPRPPPPYTFPLPIHSPRILAPSPPMGKHPPPSPPLSPQTPTTTSPPESENPLSIHRTKGLIRHLDGATKMLQGVREVFDITDLDAAASGEGEGGKIVLIGRGLRRGMWKVVLRGR
ncbi:hypothetical protein G7Y79_00019g047350 [Physcia stellaris]|nr:hypothetical protein G7Y79_00019g047350 [Physcia stellaris]